MIETKTLPNGVRILLEPMEGMRSAALGIWVGAGSRHEAAGESARPKTKRRKRGDQLSKGDLVHHTSFGDGVVIRLEDGLATIAFAQKFGVRKIMADHPALSRK